MNRTTSFNCNGAGQITQVTDPLSRSTLLTYAHGGLASTTDPLGKVTSSGGNERRLRADWTRLAQPVSSM